MWESLRIEIPGEGLTSLPRLKPVTSKSEQKEQTNREKYAFYCSVTQIHINSKKKDPIKMTFCLVPTFDIDIVFESYHT